MSETGTPSLQHIQRWMQAVLINPLGTTEQAPHTFLPQHLQDQAVENVVCASERMSPREHLALYQRSYLLRLRGCMNEQFPALKHALGDALFQGFVDQYLQTFPPQHYSLNDLGRRFPEYLDQTRPDKDSAEKESWPDFLIELARFEFAVARLFDAHELAEADAHKPKLASVMQLFAHQFPVLPWYREAMAGKEPELPFPQKTYALIVRKDYRLALIDLQPTQYHFLSWLKQGSTLDDAKARLLEESGKDEREVALVLDQWLERMREFGVFTP